MPLVGIAGLSRIEQEVRVAAAFAVGAGRRRYDSKHRRIVAAAAAAEFVGARIEPNQLAQRRYAAVMEIGRAQPRRGDRRILIAEASRQFLLGEGKTMAGGKLALGPAQPRQTLPPPRLGREIAVAARLVDLALDGRFLRRGIGGRK